MRRFRLFIVMAVLSLLSSAFAPIGISPADSQVQQSQVQQGPEGEAAAVNDTVGAVERAYRTVLGRSPEPDGLAYWISRLNGGLDPDEMLAIFMASPERAEKYPADQSDADFLAQLYIDAFGRDGDAEGLEYWAGRLGDGLPRFEVVKLFADSPEQRIYTAAAVSFELNVLHINDHHSHLQADSGDITLAGEGTRVEVGGFPRVVAKFDELTGSYDADANVAKLHAGDAITGTLFFSLFKGEADAALMNEICFDAFALGNHEFDESDEGLKTFLDFLATPDCDTPVLGANIVPEVGTPLAEASATDYIRPFIVENYANGRVGYIGIDIAAKTQNSSSPLDSTQFLDEVETSQRYIDELTADGVDKIVLITHYQYENDLALAGAVSGVDVIIGGDSHSLLGDWEDRGLTSAGPYPTMTTDADGLPVCIAQAWQYAAVVGELSIGWDQYGHVATCEGTPHLLLGDTFMRRPADGGDRVPVEGDALAAILADIESDPQLSIVTPDADSQLVLDGYSEEVDVLAMQSIGTVTEDLCLERIPGQGRSSIEGCTELTAVNGGDIQQLVAEAFRARSFEADIALQNAGGVRIDIPSGDLTIADAYTLLPFANTLVNLEMTGQQIKDSLEEGTENAVMPDGSTGAYPYAAGLRWDMDLTQPAGSRVSNLEYQAKGTTDWLPFDLTATYTVVTNNFMAGGGDGYATMEEITDAGLVEDTFLDYAKSFIDYVEIDRQGVLSKVPVDQYSTQNFVPLPAE